MFDQSFSAKNIEVVFNTENRKGHIDFSRMPQGYIDHVTDIRALRAEMAVYNRRKKRPGVKQKRLIMSLTRN